MRGGGGEVVDKVVNLFLSSFLYLAGFLKTLSPNGPFAFNSYLQTKSATIACFSSPPFFLLALAFSPFLFLRYSDFGTSRA